MQFKYLKYDLYRYFYFYKRSGNISIFRKLRIIFITQGIWAIIVYRIRRWVEYECKFKVVKIIFNPIGTLMGLWIQIVAGILIEPMIDIGPGFYIGHFGNIFIGGPTKIGKMCNVSQGCSLGWAGRGEKLGIPEIGDFVYIAPGAKVIGKVKIGNCVAIGANSVVTKSLEDNAVAVGIPAKVISHEGSLDFILYDEAKFDSILK